MKIAPEFKLEDQNGNIHTLRDYRGKWVVLYFYPKDDTPGCTTEACGFRDARSAIAEFGNAVVIGISQDSPRSHKRFADKYSLDFTLLSDTDHSVIEAYGAWGSKTMFGKTFDGIIRSTFIISPDGVITKEYPKVNPEKHAFQIVTDLGKLQNS